MKPQTDLGVAGCNTVEHGVQVALDQLERCVKLCNVKIHVKGAVGCVEPGVEEVGLSGTTKVEDLHTEQPRYCSAMTSQASSCQRTVATAQQARSRSFCKAASGC